MAARLVSSASTFNASRRRLRGPPIPPFAALVPVGPAAGELDRLGDLVDSLLMFEPTTRWIVVVDDAPDAQRDVRASLPSHDAPAEIHVLRNHPHPRRRAKTGGLCTADLLGLAWIQRQTHARFVLRIDTDALVIAPFAGRVNDMLRADRTIGMVGSFDRTCNGEPRDFSPHHRVLRRAMRPVIPIGWRRRIRDVIERALAAGYQVGEHCLGGACVISREMIDHMADIGAFRDVPAWSRSAIPDDVMLGIFTRAVGLRSRNATAAGELFGLKYVGLADTPAGLAERGYSFVHSVKSDPRFSEDAIRSFYRARRHAAELPHEPASAADSAVS